MPLIAPAALRPTGWVSRTLPVQQNWYTPGWGGPGKWAALGSTGTGAYTTNNGATWSTATVPTSSQWNGISTDPDNLVMVACNAGASVTKFIRSTDGGATWSNTTVPSIGALGYSRMAFGGGAFVAVGGNANTTQGIYSTDGGLTWGTSTLPASINWQAVCYDGTRFIAVGASSNVAALSTDGGATWSSGGNLPATANWVSIAAGNGTIVAARDAAGGSATAYSTDGGATWSAGALPFSGCYAIYFHAGVFLAVAVSGTGSAWSYNATSWTSLTLTASKTWVMAAPGDGAFMTVSWSANDTVAAIMPLRTARPVTTVQAITRAAVF